jgi:hypothetical protein
MVKCLLLSVPKHELAQIALFRRSFLSPEYVSWIRKSNIIQGLWNPERVELSTENLAQTVKLKGSTRSTSRASNKKEARKPLYLIRYE